MNATYLLSHDESCSYSKTKHTFNCDEHEGNSWSGSMAQQRLVSDSRTKSNIRNESQVYTPKLDKRHYNNFSRSRVYYEKRPTNYSISVSRKDILRRIKQNIIEV